MTDLEFYETPAPATRYLFRDMRSRGAPIVGRLLEPCVGSGAIVEASGLDPASWITNDLDPTWPAQTHDDATQRQLWDSCGAVDWTVTNPHFSGALEVADRARQAEGHSPSTVNRELATLSHIYSSAVRWKWITHRAFRIKKLTEKEGRIIYLTEDQAARLSECAKASDNPYLWMFIQIGLDTGMRRMEILSIAIRNINLKRRYIHIPKAKAGERDQPITARLAEILALWLDQAEPGQEWLFPAPKSKTGHAVAIEKAFRTAVRAAGMDPKEVVRHTMRHTTISHVVQVGVDLPTVQKISGHKTLSALKRYIHQNDDHIQAAMDKLEQRLSVQNPGATAQDLHMGTKKA